MIKGIIFDAFGTLISTGNGSLEATSTILKNNNSTIDPKVFYSVWKQLHRDNISNSEFFITEEESFRISLEKAYESFGIKGSAENDVKIMLDTLVNRSLFPETQKTIKAISGKFVLCIGSNTDTLPLLENLKHTELSFDRIYTSEMLQLYKPDKRFYQCIVEDLGLDAEELLFVGDSLIDDVWGPQQLKIKTCHVNRLNASYQDIVPDYSVSALDEILEIVF